MQNRSWYKKRAIRNIFSAEQLAFYYAKFFLAAPINVVSFSLKRVIKYLVNQFKPSLDKKVIYITIGGTNSLSDVLTKTFSKLDIEVITILENWDNMTSKAVFQNPPKKIGVWGEQSVKFGSLIHNIDPKIIVPIGNPRIEWLLRNVNKSPNPKNIFFGGGSVNLKLEITYLVSAIKIAKNTGSIVEYLPHPKNYKYIEKLKSNISSENLKILGNYNNEIEINPANLPKLETYLDPFENSKVFISPLSTMNLEASLLGIPSIALDISTKINLPDNKISDRHDHIHDIRDTEIFYFIESIEEYEKLLESLMSNSLSRDDLIAKQKILKYLINSDSDYMENLLNLIN
jgi:predicted glycosyltransferase